MAFYVLDDNNNRVLAFDQEGILAVLQQAIAEQSLENINPDSAVASRLRSIINGTAHHIEFVTQAQYNELEAAGELVQGCYYFITDDDTVDDLDDAIAALQAAVEALTETLTAKTENYKTFNTWAALTATVYSATNLPTQIDMQYQSGQNLLAVRCLPAFEYDSNDDGYKIKAVSYIDASGNVTTINTTPSGARTFYVWKRGGWD